MNQRRRVSLTQVTSLLLATTLTLSSTGCIVSSTEAINTDKTYLLGPKTESVPGPSTRDVTIRAVDTHGSLAFHLDRARECTVTSTPRYQTIHVQGKVGKNLAAGIITGALLTGVGGFLIALPTITEEPWSVEKYAGSSDSEFTGMGILGLTGVIVGIVGLVILPRGIYHAAVSGTTVVPGEVKLGIPPPASMRAPAGYDPNEPEYTGLAPLAPRLEQPRYDVLSFGSKPAGEIEGIPTWARAARQAPPAGDGESLRSESAFDRAVNESETETDPALLGIPQASGGGSGLSDEMKACVAKHTPSCQAKCGNNKPCVLACLRKPCIENAGSGENGGAGGQSGGDEYTEVLSKREVCERSADSGVALALIVKNLDGVPRTIDLGRTDKNGDIKKDLLGELDSAYPDWPDVKQVVLQEAEIVLVEDPTVVLGKLDLAKYPSLKYAEHVQSTRKAREAMVAAEAARKEKEARDRQAMLEAAAKAEDDALHAEERKAEAAKKAAACASQQRNKCNADCQGNGTCVKKCLQKMPSCR